MILIEKKNYSKLIPSLQRVHINHLFVRTVLEQKMDGDVYVNSPIQPTTYFAKHAYGMSLLWGNHKNETFNNELKSYLLNTNKKRHKNEWLQVFPNTWIEKLEDLLGQDLEGGDSLKQDSHNIGRGKVVKYTRVNFRFNPQNYFAYKLESNSGLELVRISNRLFQQMKGTVIPSNFWRNEQEFHNHGVGFCLLSKGKPISTAFSAFVHKSIMEVGIETLPEFHGQGYAAIVCSALIDYCLDKKREPVWACRLENTGSFKLAIKLGFEVERMIPYYQLPK